MRHAPLAAVILLAACSGPRPCTRTLCVARLDGTMELAGWNGRVTAASDSPKPPVVSDTVVTMLNGTAEFRNGKTRVAATEGSSFRFTVSTRAVSSIEATAGAVTVVPSTGAPALLGLGVPYFLPKP